MLVLQPRRLTAAMLELIAPARRVFVNLLDESPCRPFSPDDKIMPETPFKHAEAWPDTEPSAHS